MTRLNSKIPKGKLSDKWTNHKAHINLVSPANKRLLFPYAKDISDTLYLSY